jgi:hypothetical protein
MQSRKNESVMVTHSLFDDLKKVTNNTYYEKIHLNTSRGTAEPRGRFAKNSAGNQDINRAAIENLIDNNINLCTPHSIRGKYEITVSSSASTSDIAHMSTREIENSAPSFHSPPFKALFEAG